MDNYHPSFKFCFFMEEWKDIEGYEGLYQVNNTGKVISLNYKRTGEVRELKPMVDKYGYLYVNLSKNGKYKSKKIHRLVAEAFIPNPNNLPEVNHRNEIKTDNRVENIEYCDRSYNINYGSRNKKLKDRLCKPILQFTLDGDFIREWEGIKKASDELCIKQPNISNVCLGNLKTAGGYKWKYK